VLNTSGWQTLNSGVEVIALSKTSRFVTLFLNVNKSDFLAKSRRKRKNWDEHVTLMGRTEMRTVVQWENLKYIYHFVI